MVPFVETGDESMSEGDESDNVDLTDGSSYNSDGSEWTQGIFFYQLCLDYSLTEHIEGASAGFEHTPASRYSNVSRHYSLPIAGPSLWVGDPVVALRVRYLLPSDLRCSHLRLLLGSSSVICSCYAPRSHVEGGRTLPLQEVEGRHNRQQEQYFDYSRDQPFN